jgi:hypothetical protein
MSAFAWDFLAMTTTNILMLVVFAIFDFEQFRGSNLGIVFLLLMLFAWAVPPLQCVRV